MTSWPAVGWIGIGAMGAPMAQRMLAAGCPVSLWARRREAATALLAAGARWQESPAALARSCDVVFTILGGPDDVRAVVGSMIDVAKPATQFVDMTTASPALAAEFLARRPPAEVALLDAPVTGGVKGAREGTLTMFVGGNAAAVERIRPLASILATRLVPCGETGMGYRMKLVNQTMMVGTLLGLANGVAAARSAGVDAQTVTEAFGAGSASSFLFNAYAQRMLLREGPETFSLGLLRKDLALARDDAQSMGIDTRFLDFALASVALACDRLGAHRGIQALAF